MANSKTISLALPTSARRSTNTGDAFRLSALEKLRHRLARREHGTKQLATGLRLGYKLKAHEAKRSRLRAARGGLYSIPAVEHEENERRAQGKLADLERENARLRERDIETRAHLLRLRTGNKHLCSRLRALRDKYEVSKEEASRLTHVCQYLMLKLAEAVAWNGLQYCHGRPPGEYPVTSSGLSATLSWDGGELDWEKLETWLARIEDDVRGLCGEPGVERLEELARGLRERQYGMASPADEEDEEDEEEEEDDDDSGDDHEELVDERDNIHGVDDADDGERDTDDDELEAVC
ncbi:hypothetical protein B0A55_06639 [Friedmanniomyces simplex]|uniref:Uncharacterized protein n=1 Tax=Friedmanniomyces simplex TaxID=329884 RepID=A0A4U0XK82_9PEZI|nr:hypothetical protein B0A55_06639 [Friedmanniomyces simplex]